MTSKKINNTKIINQYLNNKFEQYSEEIENFNRLDFINQFSWIVGMFQTDGYFSYEYKHSKGTKTNNPRNYRINFFFGISQKEQYEIVCVLFAFFFQKEKFHQPEITLADREELSKKGKKISQVEYRWYSTISMIRLIKMVDEALVYGTRFFSTKYYDILVIKEMLNLMPYQKKSGLTERSPENAIKLLDLKYALHQPDSEKRVDMPNIAKSRLLRSTWEQRLNLEVNSSINAAKNLLQKVDETYVNYVNVIDNLIISNKLNINPRYITGVLEGDGSLIINILNDSFKAKSYRPLQLNFSITLAGDDHGIPLAKVVAYYFQDKNPTIKIFRHDKDKRGGTSLEISFSKIKNMEEFFINHFSQYPLQIPEKQLRFKILIHLFKMLYYNPNIKVYPDPKLIYYTVKAIYNLEGQGKQRSVPYSDIKKNIDNYCLKHFGSIPPVSNEIDLIKNLNDYFI